MWSSIGPINGQITRITLFGYSPSQIISSSVRSLWRTAEKKLLPKPVGITAKTSLPSSKQSTGIFCSSFSSKLKDVRANCYCASLVRTLFIRHARATSFSSVCTKSKTQQNIQLMTFTLTWCANIFVGCSVTSTFFSWSLPFVILSIMLKNKKKSVRGKF